MRDFQPKMSSICSSPTSGSDAGQGANLRKYSPTAEVVAPFCGRAYMRAAFQFDALHRWTEPLHYQMLRMLDRRLHRMPFQSGQRRMEEPECDLELAAAVRSGPAVKRASALESSGPVQVSQSPYHQVDWLEAHLPLVRQVCLDTAQRRLMAGAESRAPRSRCSREGNS